MKYDIHNGYKSIIKKEKVMHTLNRPGIYTFGNIYIGYIF